MACERQAGRVLVHGGECCSVVAGGIAGVFCVGGSPDGNGLGMIKRGAHATQRAKGQDAMSIYSEMIAAGVQCESHESDLYVPVNDTTRAIVERFEFENKVRTFANQVEGCLWHDIPFAFDPYWE